MKEEKFFLTQIKRTNGTFEKGVVVKDTLNAARQSYHAYLGAYGFGNSENTDYVCCFISDVNGRITDAYVDDRRITEDPEPIEEGVK